MPPEKRARGQLDCWVFVDNSDKWIAHKWKQRKTRVTLWSKTSPEAFPTINFKEYLTVTDENYNSRKPKLIDKQLVFRPKQHNCNHKKERLAAEQLVFLTEKSNHTSILASIQARNLEETHFQWLKKKIQRKAEHIQTLKNFRTSKRAPLPRQSMIRKSHHHKHNSTLQHLLISKQFKTISCQTYNHHTSKTFVHKKTLQKKTKQNTYN